MMPIDGWYSRNYLPHLNEPGRLQGVTFRLHDSLPIATIDEWKLQLAWTPDLPSTDPRDIELYKRISRYEDAHHGACWLRQHAIAEMTEDVLLHFDGQRYQLHAWCIMPNHVHALVQTEDSWKLENVLHSWKSFTAQKANAMLGRNGPFWFREYHDRFIRNEEHYCRTLSYIEENPVKGGLVPRADLWPFSSARFRATTQ